MSSAPVERPGEGPSGEDGPHFFVADVATPVLVDEDEHHLRGPLRRRDGDVLTVSDGKGRWRRCRLGSTLEPVPDRVGDGCEAGSGSEGQSSIFVVNRPVPPVGLGFALVKGSKPELVTQKLTELGADLIVPFTADHSVVRWDPAKAARNHARLQRIAREAAMQSRRVWLPTIEPVSSFSALASRSSVACADQSGSVPILDYSLILVGPEGGWSAAERSRLLPTVSVGPHVLRAETAAIAVGAVLVALRSGLVSGTPDPGKTPSVVDSGIKGDLTSIRYKEKC